MPYWLGAADTAPAIAKLIKLALIGLTAFVIFIFLEPDYVVVSESSVKW